MKNIILFVSIITFVVFVFLISGVIYINSLKDESLKDIDYSDDKIKKTIINKEKKDNNKKYKKTIIENASLLQQHKPSISSGQLNEYMNIIQEDKSIKHCLEFEDRELCQSSVAFIAGDMDYCHYFEGSFKSKKEANLFTNNCEKLIVVEQGAKNVEACQKLTGDKYYDCLRGIFHIFLNKKDCATIKHAQARSLCMDIITYKNAYIKYNQELCKDVKDKKLNNYCKSNILSKTQDTDNDGLPDLDEIRIHQTDPKNPDTDGDGYTDGEEVQAGYNPLGKGKLK